MMTQWLSTSVVQAAVPEFKFLARTKSTWLCISVALALRRTDRQILGAGWLGSLTQMVSFRFSGIPCLKRIRWGLIEEDICYPPLVSLRPCTGA